MEKTEIPKLSSKKIFSSWYIQEPTLIFGDGKTHIDPKLGLTLYGPLRSDEGNSSTPLSIRVGIIGTGETMGQTKLFLSRLNNTIESENKDPFQNPSFPGFNNAFNCKLIQSESNNSIISEREIDEIFKKNTFESMVNYAANLFLKRIEGLSEVTPRPNILLCALPQKIIDYCVVKKTSQGKFKKKESYKEKKFIKTLKELRKNNQTFLGGFEEEVDKILEDSITTGNFWRELKAGAMQYGMPTQIIWPSTITPSNELKKNRRQEDSSTAWNLAVALYYKGSGFPWTMTKMKKGTCYVGISFFKDLTEENKMRTSMAQIFTYTGEGLILRGEQFEWDTDKGKSPHLTEENASALLEQAINLYTTRMNESPSRVVIHKSSKYWDDERQGFEKVLKKIKNYDMVAFGQRHIRFFRYGQYPPLRGTVIKTGKGNYLLYTRGYIPYLRTYPGGHVPLPLDIVEHFGDSDPQTILSEILALSKMNWNSAEFSLAQPITLLFSKKVGNVMASLSDTSKLKHEYLYYM